MSAAAAGACRITGATTATSTHTISTCTAAARTRASCCYGSF